MRFMSLYKPGEESAGPPSEQVLAKLGGLIAEMAQSGALLATDGLLPSMHGARVQIAGDSFMITDGPFTETKDVIGGYAILDAASKAEAIEFAKRFLAVMGAGECEVRQMVDQNGTDCGGHRAP